MKKLIFIMLVMLFSSVAFGQEKEERKIKIVKIGKPEKQPDGTTYQETIEIDYTNELSAVTVKKLIKKVEKILKEEEKGNKTDSALLGSLAYDLLYYSYHPDTEFVTEVYSSWYKDVSKHLNAMAQLKSTYNLGKFTLDAKARASIAKRYKSVVKSLNKLLENPKKIKEDVLKKLKKKRKK